MDGFEDYQSKRKNVSAIQFTFDNLKLIYSGLKYRDVNYYIQNRVISGIITDPNGKKLNVAKNDMIVVREDNSVIVMKPAEFEAEFEKKSDIDSKLQKIISDEVEKIRTPLVNELKDKNTELESAKAEVEKLRLELDAVKTELENIKLTQSDENTEDENTEDVGLSEEVLQSDAEKEE
jgi:hypothetical protein